MTAYYNEIDSFAAAWLRELIKAGHIAPGIVDERSIEDVSPSDLSGFTQCHFFAGIGVWSYALRRAGWPDDKPVWTGSCPCQPFSSAGKGAGFDDERHLWPDFHWLISQCRPPVVLGEQVESKAGRAWLDLVQADLEGSGYAVGAVAFPSAGVGAPHIRSRSWWVAERLGDTGRPGLSKRVGDGRIQRETMGAYPGETVECAGYPGGLADALEGRRARKSRSREAQELGAAECGEPGGLAYAGCTETFEQGVAGQAEQGCNQSADRIPSGSGSGMVRSVGADNAQSDGSQVRVPPGEGRGKFDHECRIGRMADANSVRRQCQSPRSGGYASGDDKEKQMLEPWAIRDIGRMADADCTGPLDGFWGAADWLFCRDGKWRPVEPGTQPLAHGSPARVGRLRGYGNAINAEAAGAFIEAYLTC